MPTDACGIQPKVTANEGQSPEHHYTCTWMKDTTPKCVTDVTIHSGLSQLASDVLPPAPIDVVLNCKELRMYKTKAGTLTYWVPPQNVYYHLQKTYALVKNKHFATEDLFVKLAGLKASHIDQLCTEFVFVIQSD